MSNVNNLDLKKRLLECDNDENNPKKLSRTSNLDATRFIQERLQHVLRCTVCLDTPIGAMFQCTNGHLMCEACLLHLLADARLKNEPSTCPNCRVPIAKSSCTRNLAVEKAIGELPMECVYCEEFLCRSHINLHMKEECKFRPVSCEYSEFGCSWSGRHKQLAAHLASGDCAYPDMPGRELLLSYKNRKVAPDYSKQLVHLLSSGTVTYIDVQLKPYRTDDYDPILFFESQPFPVFEYNCFMQVNVASSTPEAASGSSSPPSARQLTFCMKLKKLNLGISGLGQSGLGPDSSNARDSALPPVNPLKPIQFYMSIVTSPLCSELHFQPNVSFVEYKLDDKGVSYTEDGGSFDFPVQENNAFLSSRMNTVRVFVFEFKSSKQVAQN